MILSRSFLSPTQKIVYLIISSLLSVTIDNEFILTGYLGVCTLILLLTKIPGGKFKIWVISVLLTFWGTLFSQSLFYNQVPRSIIIRIVSDSFPVIGQLTGGINIYKEGIQYGLVQGLRFVITLTCGLYICFTTESKEILRAAIRLKIPVNVSFMVSIALRFIPLIIDESKTVLRAQKLRGFNVAISGCVHPLQTARLLLRPILVNAVRRSSMLSLSVESRHFNKTKSLYCNQVKEGSLPISIFLLVIFCAIICAVIIKIIYFLYISNYCYISLLRPLYFIGEKWL